MLVPAAAPPAITPPPNLARAVYGGLLAPRQLNYGDLTDPAGGGAYGGGSYNDCLYGAGMDINGMQECNSLLYSCTSAYTDVNNYITDCYCTYGISLLDCYWNKMGTCVSQLYGTGDWRDYQTSFFSEWCGSIPPSAFAQIEAPSEVPLSFTKAKIVTTPGRVAMPTNVEPKYSGTGQLLAGPCSASTDYTLVNAGATIYAAGVVGCNGNRPECCPWKVGEMGSAGGASPAGGTEDQNKNRVGVDFPQPADNAQAVLAGCAQDYYSVSGGCCPVGYWPFTAAVGGQTPCYSSVNRMTVGTVTVGAEDEKTKDTSKPTSAVVNIVWSMRYQVEETKSGGLSTGAKAGIGAGVGIVAIALLGLGAWFFWRRRKSKKVAGEKPAAAAPVTAAAVPPQADPLPPKQPEQVIQQQQMMPHQGYYAPGQPAPGQYPPGQYPPGTVFMPAPGGPPPSDQMSYATNMTVSSPSTIMPQHTGTTMLSDVSSQNQQQQYFAFAAPNQQMQQSGSPPPQIQPVPGTVPSPPPQAQQQQFGPPQTGPISPQELQGQQQQFGPPHTGPISPQELQGQQQQFAQPQAGPGSPQELQGQQQLVSQQMVWDQNVGGYVLPQQQVQQFYQPQQQTPQQQQQQPPPPQ